MQDGFKAAIVTGAAGEVGRAICRRLASDGFTLILCDADPRVAELARELSGSCTVAHHFIHDVSREEDWEILNAFIEQEIGSIQVLVNHAGFRSDHSILNGTWNDWHRSFEVNVQGAFLAIRTLAPSMRGVEGAAIVNVASGAAGNFDAAWTSSQWALRGLTRSAALELAKWGIRVNAVLKDVSPAHRPGAFPASPGALRAAARRERAERVAAAVGFLCGPDSAGINGADLVVNGSEMLLQAGAGHGHAALGPASMGHGSL